MPAFPNWSDGFCSNQRLRTQKTEEEMNSTGHKHKREKSLLKQLSRWVNPHGSVNISRQMLVENQKTERSNICTHPSPQQDGPEFNYQHEVFWTCPASPVPSHSAKTSTLNWRETPMSDCCVCVCVLWLAENLSMEDCCLMRAWWDRLQLILYFTVHYILLFSHTCLR